MSDLMNIENIGYTANNNPSRAMRNGAEYEELFPAPDWREEVTKRNADVSQTVHEMKKLVLGSAWQTKALSKRLMGKDIYTTCGNIWNFLFKHFKYKEDDAGEEQLRTPALSWHLRTSRGIDCDDFSIFASTILNNLGIPHYLRIARYGTKNYFQHVYVVVPQTGKHYITIDGVLDEYDTEKEPAETKDFLIMSTSNNLNGIDVSVLSGLDSDDFNELSGVLFGVDFERVNELEGLGQIACREEELGSIYNHLVRTRNLIQRRPHYIRHVENPDNFLGMLDYAIGYWNTDKRDEALNALEEQENELNRLQGLDKLPDGYEDTTLFYGVAGLGGVTALGRVKAKRGFFKKVKEAAKKVGAGIKKIAKKIIKFNPLTLAIRGGVLLAMKTNLFKMASKIKWGYLTEEEARSNGFDMSEWHNAKNQLHKIEKMYVDTLQGDATKLKKSIISGRAGGLSGLESGDNLGVAVAAATGASVAAATPFINKILQVIKNINFSKLIANVKPALLKLKGKQAEGDSEPDSPETEAPTPPEETEIKTALPEGNTESPQASSSNSLMPTNNISEPSNDAGNNITANTQQNLPATQENSLPNTTDTTNTTDNITNSSAARAGEENVFTKAMNWVKENPGKSALIAGGLILGVTALIKMSPKKSLGRSSRRGKTRKGKNKKHPPRTISGVKKKTLGKTKKTSAKRKTTPHKRTTKKSKRNRGGSPPQVTL